MPTVNSNRDKKTAPKLGKTWCWSCDGALVADGARCPSCGKRHARKVRKGNPSNRVTIISGEEAA